ncbi:MAG: S-adenosylmethionine:tRNA ribosyltransferase-isomerase, partial [Xanthomonadales bacterium]|nr:S-adenosylmethionine:tRNA ribosyltransferase-isomerase [Xanthomonadales bacterium]
MTAPDLADYDFALPPELIAQTPTEPRSASRLLLADPLAQHLADHHFADLVQLLRPGDLLVCNDTRVIPARLFGQRPTGGKVELFLERLLDPQRLLMQLRCSKKPRVGEILSVDGGGRLQLLGRDGGFFELQALDESAEALLQRAGHVPLPPYIERADNAADRERY